MKFSSHRSWYLHELSANPKRPFSMSNRTICSADTDFRVCSCCRLLFSPGSRCRGNIQPRLSPHLLRCREIRLTDADFGTVLELGDDPLCSTKTDLRGCRCCRLMFYPGYGRGGNIQPRLSPHLLQDSGGDRRQRKRLCLQGCVEEQPRI